MTTMLLGGLWHGANWTFVFWGGIHGAGFLSSVGLRASAKRPEKKPPSPGRGYRASYYSI